jgi:Sortase domain
MSLTSRGRRFAGPRLGPGRPPAPDQTRAEGETGTDAETRAAGETGTGGESGAGGETSAGRTTPARPPKHRRARIGPLALAGRPAVVAVGVGLLMAGSGTAGLLMTGHSRYVPPHVARVKPVLPPVGPQQQTPAPALAEQVSPPVSLTIPVIGVRTRIIRLGLTRSGALQVPSSTAVAGWYTGSPRPGAVGSSVIAGHVDSYLGPGVFYRLDQLHRGELIYVRQAGGRLAVFQVISVHLYPHASFPRTLVYGPTPTPTLRLITCGGTFDYETRGYLSNVVVYATLTS